MRGRATGHDFVDPMILKILSEANASMTTLGINYMVNQAAGRTINLGVIKDHLSFLVQDKKILENLDKDKGITYYKLVL
jgi:hypothetical protein